MLHNLKSQDMDLESHGMNIDLDMVALTWCRTHRLLIKQKSNVNFVIPNMPLLKHKDEKMFE